MGGNVNIRSLTLNIISFDAFGVLFYFNNNVKLDT